MITCGGKHANNTFYPLTSTVIFTMLGALAVPIIAFAFWVWTWDKGAPYLNQEPGVKWRAKAKVAARNRSKVLEESKIAWNSGQKGAAKTVSLMIFCCFSQPELRPSSPKGVNSLVDRWRGTTNAQPRRSFFQSTPRTTHTLRTQIRHPKSTFTVYS